MSVHADRVRESFAREYASALSLYLSAPGEDSLRVAYELGRQAITRALSVLDLVLTHQEALSASLTQVDDVSRLQQAAAAAGDFLLEGLSSYEMVQRRLEEAREALLINRRQTELSRQLSTFLADVSLALDASDSLAEMLRLVAEQARELVRAECCVVTVIAGGELRAVEAASYPEADRRWTTLVRWLDLGEIYRLLREAGGSARSTGDQLVRSELFRGIANQHPLVGWLAASLSTLDGGELGAIQLFDTVGNGFTAEDEAGLVHLAQMASAALERARLYHRDS